LSIAKWQEIILHPGLREGKPLQIICTCYVMTVIGEKGIHDPNK